MEWRALDGQRERRMLDSWPDSGDELHILTWQQARDSAQPLASFAWSTFQEGCVSVHKLPRIPNLLGRFTNNYARGFWANEQLFRYYATRLVRKLGIDIIVYGNGHKVIGLPPFDLPIPRVFDYLDLCTYPDVEEAYITNSDLVLCTSKVLVERVKNFGKDPVYIPNGVTMGRLALGQRDRTRANLGLRGKQVVSLIGLTASRSLFFVDALAIAASQLPDLVFLLVGEGELLQPIVERCRQLEVRFVATGRIPNNEVANYFAASDIGLYPGDSNPYFDAACPIKVLEYTAIRRPVVASDLEELRRMAFPNVRLSPPHPKPFSSAIIDSLNHPTAFGDVSSFEWAALARKTRETLLQLSSEARIR
jgi:glycosyltransferase involved in cell wall biosynthesis